MKIRMIIGVVVASLAVAGVAGCASTSKAGDGACCAKCGPGCKCGGKSDCCKQS